MENLVKENENKIERLDASFYLSIQDYASAAAISALDTTNEIQKKYFAEEGCDRSSNAMRLYALLQGLFVSVDSLYSLAETIGHSKNFININNNKYLRELKYIRNDVVGHPANRTLSDHPAYCILDVDSINKEGFKYHLYSRRGVEEKRVSITDIVKAYYNEANNFLDALYDLAKKEIGTEKLKLYAENMAADILANRDYSNNLEALIETYKGIYTNAKKEQHRVLWRYETYLALKKTDLKDSKLNEILAYSKDLLVLKIYRLITDKEIKYNKSLPANVASLYRFLNSNKDLYDSLKYIRDFNNPQYLESFSSLFDRAKMRKANGALFILNMLEAAYKKGDEDILAAIIAIFAEYKRK